MNDTTDWFDVEQIGDGTHQITEGEGHLPCHMFIIEDSDEPVLVDTGLGIGDLRSFVGIVTDVKVEPRVLLTHAHWDHLGAAHQFDDVSINNRERDDEGQVAIDTISNEFTQRPDQFIENWLNLSMELPKGFDSNSYGIEPINDVSPLAPGDEVEVGDRTLELVPIPGHSPGQLAVLDRAAGICHGADIIEPGGKIYAHFRDSDIEAYRETIDRLLALHNEGAYDCLTLGHGGPIRGDDLSVLEDVAAALDVVAADKAAYDLIETNWGATREYDIDGITVLTAARSDEEA